MEEEKILIRLYKQFQHPLFLFVNRQLHNVHISEEIVQDVFIAYAEAVRSKTRIQSVSAYLYTIARYKTIDYIRKKKLKNILFSALPKQMVDICASLFFEDKVKKEEMEDRVYRVLSRLPHDYALVIRLKYIEGFSVRTISKKLETSFKKIESMLFRARKAFAKQYQS